MITLDEYVKKISVLGNGTKEKLMIINMLKDGEKPYYEIQKIFPNISKSTIYKYLNELCKGRIIKKRVEKSKGKRPISFYSLDSLSIDLSPLGIRNAIEGKEGNKIFADMNVNVKGKGITSKFSQSRLISDLLSAGIKIETALDVLKGVKSMIYDGITTEEIKNIVIEILENKDKKIAEMFKEYIDDKLKVNNNGYIEIWKEDEISARLREYKKKGEFTNEELKFLSHKVVRDIKKITLFPSKGMVEEYIKFIADMY